MPYKRFTPGQRLPSAEVQAYLMDQAVAQFATASHRASSIPYPKTGQLTWLDVPGSFEYWDGDEWRPMGALVVANRAALPVKGSLGMEAIEAGSGQRWQWRNVNGTEVWTWPREAQGTLARTDFAPTAAVAMSNTVGQLTALPSPLFDVPPGRRLHLTLSGVLSSTSTGTWAFILQAAGAERRIPVVIPIANVPIGFHGEWEFDVEAGLTGHRVSVVAGPLSGTGTVSLSAPIDGPTQVVVRDVGATTAGTDRLQL